MIDDMLPLLFAVVAALAVLVTAYLIYSYTQSETVDVSKRVGSYADKKTHRSHGDMWEDLKDSKVKSWASIIASRFGNLLPRQQYFADLAERANIPVTGGELLVLIIGSTALWFVIISILLVSVTKAIVLSSLWLGMTFFYIKHMADNRMKEFDDQLGDAIVMMNNALRAGFTFQQAMDTVSKELPDPMAGEFSRALREIQLGVPLEDALNAISKRMQSEDFDLLATAVIIQRQIGGNLSSILETIGTTIRDRVKLKREVKVLTTEGVFAGWIVGLLPVFVIMMVLYMNPHYFDGFLKQSFAKYIIGFCIISELIGGFCIKKIIELKV